jgi:hypothetical protein
MAGPSASYGPVNNFGAVTTNPLAASSVLADTGALSAGLYEVRIFVGCSVAAIFKVQHRDSTNASTNSTINLRAAAGQTAEYVLKYDVNTNERIRVLPQANITGDAEVSLQAVRVV